MDRETPVIPAALSAPNDAPAVMLAVKCGRSTFYMLPPGLKALAERIAEAHPELLSPTDYGYKPAPAPPASAPST